MRVSRNYATICILIVILKILFLKITEKKKSTKAISSLRVQDIYKDKLLTYNVERRILEEVFKRPPLYNFKLDLKHRTPDLKFSLFLEIGQVITDEMDVDLPTKVIENTWNHFKGLYTQYKNLSDLPSGSGANKVPTPPMHVDILHQLDSLLNVREQFSSLSGKRFDLQPPQGRKNKNEELEPLIKGTTKLIASLNKPKMEEKCTCKRHTDAGEIDADNKFFMGLMPDFKKLKPRDQREVKFNLIFDLRKHLDRYEDEGKKQLYFLGLFS